MVVAHRPRTWTRSGYEVFREPAAGGFGRHSTFDEGREVSTLRAPDAALAAHDLLP